MTRAELLTKAGEAICDGHPMWRTKLASKIGISQKTLYRYVIGEREVSDETMRALTAALLAEADRFKNEKAKELEGIALETMVCRILTEDRPMRVSGGAA